MDFNEIEDENTLKVAKYQLQDDQDNAQIEEQKSKTKKKKPRNQIPLASWNRKLSQVFPEHKTFSVSLFEGARLARLGYRMYKYVKREKTAGRVPIMDPFNTPKGGPLMGVPIGGIGCGSITRGWRGDFIRWNISPHGIANFSKVDIDQFSVYVKRQNSLSSVLYPVGNGELRPSAISDWDFKVSGHKTHYNALFPRAWTVYEEPDPHLKLTCKQISPVIAHNYRESSLPVGVFVWTIENSGKSDAEVSIMFTFQNGMGTENDLAGGHCNLLFRERERSVVGVELIHKQKQTCVVDGKTTVYEDPLTFAIATEERSDCEVSYVTTFITNEKSKANELWKDFKEDGLLKSSTKATDEPSKKGKSIGAALAVKTTVPLKGKKEIVFAIGWDAPVARFSSGESYFKRYTKFYGNSGAAVKNMVCDALARHPQWEVMIENWQNPILEDELLPNFYKGALFNELYYLVDGGTIWTTDKPAKKDREVRLDSPPKASNEDIGHFAYLEGLEYLMYNTYDVHFYASFALIMNWPLLELSLQRDVAKATMEEYEEEWEIMHDGSYAKRKKRGAVPHDMGNPGEAPWTKVNSYCIQDISRWKDLPSKFVLQVYRDYVATGDKQYLIDLWPTIIHTLSYLQQFDKDHDGVIENEGFPDQTYDTWLAIGASAYSGGLWLASLAAAVAIANVVGDTKYAEAFARLLEKGKKSYGDKLWNGKYYKYDSSNSSHSNSIMADQLAGQWYAKACGLESIVPDANAYIALRTVFDYNVKGYKAGSLGAINGMQPDGKPDATCMQSLEVWTGTTYALAAAMLQQGLTEEAFDTAKGIIITTYYTLGYHFQTPEAWDSKGHFRAAAYMRPLSIWAIQWAWQRLYTSEPNQSKPLSRQRSQSEEDLKQKNEVETKQQNGSEVTKSSRRQST